MVYKGTLARILLLAFSFFLVEESASAQAFLVDINERTSGVLPSAAKILGMGERAKATQVYPGTGKYNTRCNRLAPSRATVTSIESYGREMKNYEKEIDSIVVDAKKYILQKVQKPNIKTTLNCRKNMPIFF